MCTCMCIYLYTHVIERDYLHNSILRYAMLYIYIYIYIYTYIHILTYVRIYIYIYIFIHMYIAVCGPAAGRSPALSARRAPRKNKSQPTKQNNNEQSNKAEKDFKRRLCPCVQKKSLPTIGAKSIAHQSSSSQRWIAIGQFQ